MTELQRLARRLADDYQFECQGGPLRNCTEWRALCAAINTLAVHPPSGASPQAEELRAANVANLREMVGMAGRHRETLLAVRECILALSPGHRTGYDWNADPLFLTLKEGRALNLIDDALKATPASPQAEMTQCDYCHTWRSRPCGEGCCWQPAPVSPVEPTTCPKCRSNTRAYRLAVADVIDGRMAGMTSCRDEWHSRMPMVSPVEPEPPVGSAAWLQSAGGSRMLGTASSKAVEPEPCVWRLSANGNYADAGCRPQEFFEAESVREWVACPYCGAPLKVEREQSDEQPSEISAAPRKPVVNLMDALRKSLESLDRTTKVPSEETPR